MSDAMRFETAAIHAGQDPDPATGAVIVPIYQTSTYVQEAVAKHKGFEYSRTDNPTRRALETCLAALEGATHAVAFAFRDGGDHDAGNDPEVGTKGPDPRRRVRRHVPVVRQGAGRPRDRLRDGRHDRPRCGQSGGVRGRRPGPGGDPDEPVAEDPRSRGHRRDRSRGRGASSRSTTRSRPPTSSDRSSSGPTWSSTPAPSTSGVTPISWWVRWQRRTTISPTGSATCRTRSAPSPARSIRGCCCGGSRPSPSGCEPTARAARRSRSGSSTAMSGPCTSRASSIIPVTTSQLVRWPRRASRSTGAWCRSSRLDSSVLSTSARRPSCSSSASRSAASSR